MKIFSFLSRKKVKQAAAGNETSPPDENELFHQDQEKQEQEYEQQETKSQDEYDQRILFTRDLLSNIADGSWALPEVDSLTAERHPFFKQKGFTIRVQETEHPKVLEEYRNELHTRLLKDEQYVNNVIEEYMHPEGINLLSCQTRYLQQQTKLQLLQDMQTSYLHQKDQLLEQKKRCAFQLIDALKKLAEAKQNLLGTWFIEVKNKVEALFAIDKEIFEKKKEASNEVYERHKYQNLQIRDDLCKIRDRLEGQSKDLQDQIGRLNAEGIHRGTARFLLAAGYAACLAAGWVFSIFAHKAGFASNDIFFYIYQGLQHTAHEIKGNEASRIFQFLGVLTIITIVGLICRSILVHLKRRQEKLFRDEEEHSFRLRTKGYSARIKARSWIVFWLGLLPIVLILGILVIFLSLDEQYKIDSKALEAASMGLLFGGLICVGMSAAMYLYIIKIVEPRIEQQQSGTRWRHYRELAYTLLGFLLAILIAVLSLLFGPEQATQKIHILIALLLFLVLCLISGFCIGYAIRYRSMFELNEDLEERIDLCNSWIDRCSGPARVVPNRPLYEEADELMSRLMAQLYKRNDNIFVTKKRMHQHFTYRSFPGTDEEGEPRRFSFTWLGNLFGQIGKIIKALLHFLEELIIPSERQKNSQQIHTALNISESEPWEREFFADLFGIIEIHTQELQDINAHLGEIELRITQLNDPLQTPLRQIREAMSAIHRRIRRLKRRMAHLQFVRSSGLTQVRQKYGRAEQQLIDGYQLGYWYTGYILHDFDHFKAQTKPTHDGSDTK